MCAKCLQLTNNIKGELAQTAGSDTTYQPVRLEGLNGLPTTCRVKLGYAVAGEGVQRGERLQRVAGPLGGQGSRISFTCTGKKRGNCTQRMAGHNTS